MKKGIQLSVTALLLLALSACGADGGGAEETSLYGQGLEIVQLMAEMARSEEYVALYTENSALQSVVQGIAAGDYSSPKAVYAIAVQEESLAAVVQMAEQELDLDQMSQGLKTLFVQKALASLPTQINARGGSEILAVSSICAVEKTFVNEAADEDEIYLYTYEDAVPAAVVFLVGERQAVAAKGFFVLTDGFACGSEEEVKASFPGVLSVEVREIFPEP